MLAVNTNRDDVSWVTSYPPYVTIELTVRRAEIRRKAGAGCSFRDRYVQDERYFVIEHMDKVRPGNGREGSLGCVRREAPRGPHMCLACPGRKHPPQRPLRIYRECNANKQIRI